MEQIYFNPLSYAQGVEIGQQQQGRNALAQYGAAAANGDKAALNALMANPVTAELGMRMQDRASERDYRAQSIAMDRERLGMAREQARMQAAEWAATVDAREAAKVAETTKAAMAAGQHFWQQKDEAGYNAYLQKMGLDPAQLPFSDFPAHYAGAMGTLEGLQGAGPEYAVSNGQFYDKNNPQAGAKPIPGYVDKDGNGLSVQMPDGTVIRQGAGAAKFTEAQSKDVTYATRAEGALGTLDANDTVLTSLPDDLAGALPYGAYLQSSEYQVAQTAALEFLQAVLRKDTGAAITKDEVREYGSVYLPAPGDTPERLAHKREARQRALQAMKAGMNPDQILAKERATARTAQAGVPDPQGPKPATAYDRMGAAELKSIDINSVPPEDLDALEAAFKRLNNGQ